MPRGITVNCIDPGPNDTGYATAGEWAHVAAQNPGGRNAEASNVVLFGIFFHNMSFLGRLAGGRPKM